MSSVAIEAPLEKSTIEWAEAKRTFLARRGDAASRHGSLAAGRKLGRANADVRVLNVPAGCNIDIALSPSIQSQGVLVTTVVCGKLSWTLCVASRLA